MLMDKWPEVEAVVALIGQQSRLGDINQIRQDVAQDRLGAYGCSPASGTPKAPS
jgi:hypothetical protein